MKHTLEKHCKICDCKGAELTKECPGIKLDKCEKNYVKTGHLIFVNGQWYVRANDL